jgi:hypothetical protein
MATRPANTMINKTFRLRVDLVKRLERRAQERGISPNAALEELVEAALPERDPIARIREFALEARRRGAPAEWKPFTKDELHLPE